MSFCKRFPLFALAAGAAMIALLFPGPLAGPTPSAAGKDRAARKGATAEQKAAALAQDVTQGALRIVGEDATVIECPLEHTDVQADICGFIARVKVTQTFRNPTNEKIEAVYVFPLPHQAAVDDMTMVIGQRRIVGVIKRRREAREIYQRALRAGQTAALLEQERPNIFTQSVGNIQPGQQVDIEISYVDVLRYDQGTYEFHFPMVVGPRYNPRQSPGQPRVVDADRINPPVLKPEQRTGHDISLTVNLDAGVPIQNLTNANHKVHTIRKGDRKARVRLLQEDSIPNKDFVLRYDVVGNKPEMAVLTHTGSYSDDAARVGKGYFMLMIQPKQDERLTKSPPREVVFLVDVSGSMSGRPTAKVREAMQQMLQLCRPQDTVQVVTFASRANKLFDRPVPVTEANIRRALDFTSALRGGGGTEMLKGVRMAIDEPIDKERLRIIVMLTDGYIGNEAEIIRHVGRRCGDQIRFWAIGIGQAPNMFLIDGVARQGGGMGKKLGLNDDTVALTQEVMTRIQRAQLAHVKIDWGNLRVSETFPAKLPELWAGRPVIVFGRYQGGGEGQITIHGTVEGDEVSWPLAVTLPRQQPEHDVLAKVWARQKIEDLMQQTYYQGSPAIEEEVTAIALDYRLMSQYTSFVAVDAESAGQLEEPAQAPRRMLVPVPLPEGTRWEGFFGEGGGGFGGGIVPLPLKLDVGVQLDQMRRPMARRLAVPAAGNRIYGANARSAAANRPSYGARKAVGMYAGRLPSSQMAPTGPAPLTVGRPVMQKAAELSRLRRSLSEANGIGEGFAAPPLPAPASLGGFANRPAFDFNANAAVLEEEIRSLAEPAYWWAAVSSLASGYPSAARSWMQKAKRLQKEDQPAAARAAYTRAYFLDQAAANCGQSRGHVAADALAALEQLHADQVHRWVKQVPALGKKLNLILRDRSIEQAIAQLSEAAGIAIRIVPGSVDDARSMLLGRDVRVSFLDLRRATVAQALDWITQPVRMRWSVARGAVAVSTARRSGGFGAWVYDVSAIALPAPDELKGARDYNRAVARLRGEADRLIRAVRQSCGLDEQAAAWFAPSQLLVFGDPAAHARVASLLEKLADPQFQPAEGLAKLHAVTSRRAQARKGQLAKVRAARRRARVAGAHDQFGWQLLAAAAAGRLDLEALTELQIAWRDPATGELLRGNGAGLVLRSLWIVREAARALPDEPELRALARAAAEQSQAAAGQALDALRKNPKDQAAYARVLFASLAAASSQAPDRGYLADALSLLKKTDHPASVFLETLLSSRPQDHARALVRIVDEGVAGADVVVLAALACRRTGGAAWEAFRARSRELLGQQPLPGQVVLLVNRLANPQLPMVLARN